MLKIIYPVEKKLNEDKVILWACNSWYNRADGYQCLDCGEDVSVESLCPHDHARPIYIDGTPCPKTIKEAIGWLTDNGEVTFSEKYL